MSIRLLQLFFGAVLLAGCSDQATTPRATPLDLSHTLRTASVLSYPYGTYIAQNHFILNKPGSWASIPHPYNLPVTAGSYIYPYHLQYNLIDKIRWPGNQFWWVGDTLFRFDHDHFAYGSDLGGCQFSETSYSRDEIPTTHGPCSAQWFDTYYSIGIERIEYPLTAEMSGPDVISLGTHTWTVAANGASGEYTYAWHASSDGGYAWSLVCGNSTQCSRTVTASGLASFKLRATVTSTQNYTNYGSYDFVSVQPVKDVTVRQPLTVWIVGPQFVRANYQCSWYAHQYGTAPFSYSWSPASSSTSELSTSFMRSVDLSVTVTDAEGRIGSASIPVETSNTYPGC